MKFVRLDDGTRDGELFRLMVGVVVSRTPDGSAPHVVRLYDDGEIVSKEIADESELIPVMIPEKAVRL